MLGIISYLMCRPIIYVFEYHLDRDSEKFSLNAAFVTARNARAYALRHGSCQPRKMQEI